MKAKVLRKGILVVFMCVFAHAARGKTIYVDVNAPGANTGESWGDAFVHLQDALAEAVSEDEILVADGVYRPDKGAGISPGDQDATFQLKSGVVIEGGYGGFEADDPYERDLVEYESILTGDLAGNDIAITDKDDFERAPDRSDNGRHVITADGVDSSAVLDGFTIAGGHAGRLGWPRGGGGLWNIGGSPTIRWCRFVDNWGLRGGAVYSQNAGGTFSWCRFEGNGGELGGSIYCEDSNTDFTLCMLADNWADDFGGGAYFKEGTTSLDLCALASNRAENSNGGGVYLNGTDATITECGFTGNYASNGGGLAGYNSSGLVADCNFAQNSTRWTGAGLKKFDGEIRDCFIGYNEAGSEGGGLSECGGRIVDCRIVANRANSAAGGMVECDGEIIRCLVMANWAKYNTGGLRSCEGAITDCVIKFNWCGDAGGGLNGCDGPITGCDVLGNYATNLGGGLYNCTGRIENCLIVGNASFQGGGLVYCGGEIVNCTISGNRAEFFGSAYSVCSGVITNCIVWGNQDDVPVRHQSSKPTYSCLQNGGGGAGCFEADPEFIGPGHWDGNDTPDYSDDIWVMGDYHLKSQVGRWDPTGRNWVKDLTHSPCIDMGDPGSDWTAELWPHGKRINVGAYGGTAQASMSHSKSGNVADFNCDDAVDALDLRMISDVWTVYEVLLKEDITRDGFTNLTDFSIFGDNWLWQQ